VKQLSVNSPAFRGIGCQRRLLVLVVVCFALAGQSHGQTGNGQLTISMTVQSSISLIFQNNPSVGTNGFCPLSNSGTNNVGLDLGTASFTGGDNLACVNFIKPVGPATYQVSSAFDVVVTKANSSSPNYRLAAEISTAPPANVTWLVNNVALTNTAFTLLDASDNYSQAITKTLQVQVKNSVPAQALLETITFLATAN
jgi:hypothetical protein